MLKYDAKGLLRGLMHKAKDMEKTIEDRAGHLYVDELDYLPILDIKKKLIEIEKAILFAYDDLVTKKMPLKYDKELKMLIPEEDTEKIDKVCEIE